VEITCAVRGLELRPDEPAAGTAAARDRLRADVPGFGADRWLSPELGAAEELVGSGALVAAVEERIGELE
jgi:histidine ammonia-lyase